MIIYVMDAWEVFESASNGSICRIGVISERYPSARGLLVGDGAERAELLYGGIEHLDQTKNLHIKVEHGKVTSFAFYTRFWGAFRSFCKVRMISHKSIDLQNLCFCCGAVEGFLILSRGDYSDAEMVVIGAHLIKTLKALRGEFGSSPTGNGLPIGPICYDTERKSTAVSAED